MSAIKDGRFPIMLDKERHLLFSLNAIDELQDKFGGYDNIGELLSGKDAIKTLKWLLTLLLNEGKDESEAELSELEVGRLVHTGNFNEVKIAIFKAFSIGNSGTPEPFEGSEDEPDEDGDEDDERKNASAGVVE